jgi:hypothetical protein
MRLIEESEESRLADFGPAARDLVDLWVLELEARFARDCAGGSDAEVACFGKENFHSGVEELAALLVGTSPCAELAVAHFLAALAARGKDAPPRCVSCCTVKRPPGKSAGDAAGPATDEGTPAAFECACKATLCALCHAYLTDGSSLRATLVAVDVGSRGFAHLARDAWRPLTPPPDRTVGAPLALALYDVGLAVLDARRIESVSLDAKMLERELRLLLPLSREASCRKTELLATLFGLLRVVTPLAEAAFDVGRCSQCRSANATAPCDEVRARRWCQKWWARGTMRGYT